jgi:hypothetical protein
VGKLEYVEVEDKYRLKDEELSERIRIIYPAKIVHFKYLATGSGCFRFYALLDVIGENIITLEYHSGGKGSSIVDLNLLRIFNACPQLKNLKSNKALTFTDYYNPAPFRNIER